MASGVVALVRHLPAGSPSIFYCIHCLVEKTDSLCSSVNTTPETDLWKSWNGELEPFKMLDLLFRLLSLVDIQVSGNNVCLQLRSLMLSSYKFNHKRTSMGIKYSI